jgi:hypothetical protein
MVHHQLAANPAGTAAEEQIKCHMHVFSEKERKRAQHASGQCLCALLSSFRGDNCIDVGTSRDRSPRPVAVSSPNSVQDRAMTPHEECHASGCLRPRLNEILRNRRFLRESPRFPGFQSCGRWHTTFAGISVASFLTAAGGRIRRRHD